MVKRFFRIEKSVSEIEGLDQFTPTPAQHRVLERALVHLEKFSSVQSNIQKKGLQLDKVRFYLNNVMQDYPCMKIYIAPDTSIVHNPQFESAVVKLFQNKERDLTDIEKAAASSLRVGSNSANQLHDLDLLNTAKISYFDEIEGKRCRFNSCQEFLMPSFLPATSCTAERAFSAAKWILTDV